MAGRWRLVQRSRQPRRRSLVGTSHALPQAHPASPPQSSAAVGALTSSSLPAPCFCAFASADGARCTSRSPLLALHCPRFISFFASMALLRMDLSQYLNT